MENKREIKFRVWDNNRKEWVHGPGYEVNILGETIVFGEILRRPDDTCVSLDNLNDLLVLQFTGLKDKNEVEIYEFDFVKDSAFLWIVRFGKCLIDGHEFIGWYLEHLEREDFNGPLSEIDEQVIEVIGNIYTHPHLLEPKKEEKQ